MKKLIGRRREKGPSRLWLAMAEGPFEVTIATYLGFVGFVGLLSGDGIRPPSLAEAVPVWLVMAWTVGVAFGGLLAALGKITNKTRTESAGLVFLGYGTSFYAVALLFVAFPNSAYSAAAFLAIAVGCILRLRVLALARRAGRIAQGIVRDEEH